MLQCRECPLCADTVAKVGGPLQVSNYRIKRARRLNQSCATHRFLEPILRVGMRKFFLQQYLPKADIATLKLIKRNCNAGTHSAGSAMTHDTVSAGECSL
jgi:hypothetical protein